MSLSKILVVSRDVSLLRTRGMVIESAGYKALRAGDFGAAQRIVMDQRPALVVVCHTFTADEQDAFARSLPQHYRRICILLLRNPHVDPHKLVEQCRAALSCEPESLPVRNMCD